ncbi:MAG: hypothetical protein JXR29_11670 [Methylothermaceae bacterium]|nr:hypothetical protein [Methylothermaceae bacterium]
MNKTLPLLIISGLAGFAWMTAGWLDTEPAGGTAPITRPDSRLPSQPGEPGVNAFRHRIAVPQDLEASGRVGVLTELRALKLQVSQLKAEMDALKKHVRGMDETIRTFYARSWPNDPETSVLLESAEVEEAQAMDTMSQELAILDSQFQQVTEDPMQTQRSQAIVEALLYELEDPSSMIMQDLTCAGRHCRAELMLAGRAAAEKLGEQLADRNGWYTSAWFDLGSDPSGNRRTVLFLSRAEAAQPSQ